MKPRSICAALLCLLAGNIFADTNARLTLPLDAGWEFNLAEAATPADAERAATNAWESVTLPHTWNAFDGQDGGSNYVRGTGWYRRQFTLPADAAGKRVLVEFDGVSRVTEVFVNGHDVGGHTGSFARFRFDVTDFVDFAKPNAIAVRVNNSHDDTIPRGGDFTVFGGLYRHARLLLTAPAHIATLDYASPGVYFTTTNVSASSADVTTRVKLANDSAKKFSGTLRLTLRDADDKEAASLSISTALAPNSAAEPVLHLRIPKPHLWNGVADPYCYHATVELVSNGKVVDSVGQPLGIRAFEVRADTGFFLNGRHVALHGVNRHQDRPGKGWAISEADHAEDFRIIQELGANTVRLAHYQHDQFFYGLCDHGGVAVWAELCFVTEPPHTPAGRDNAKEQLRELIRQNFNHPSIFFWSIGNETSNTNLAFDALTGLNAVAHEEDATRPTTYASNHSLKDKRNFIPDILAMNRYFGWYNGTYSDFGPWFDKFHADNPAVPIAVSEYGAGASIYEHEENPPVRNDQALHKGPWHPEEWQTTYHEENWLQMKTRPWLWAIYIWNMFDFSADARAEGDQFGRNDKGLVTYDRLTRKDAFYWYQANWTTNAMVHIVSKRFWERSHPQIELKIYSNCEEVEVKLAGKSLGRKTSTDSRFIWPDAQLAPGPNRVEAYAYRAGRPVAADWCSFTLRADGDPLPNKAVVESDAATARKKADADAKKKAAAENSGSVSNTPAAK